MIDISSPGVNYNGIKINLNQHVILYSYGICDLKQSKQR